METEKDKSAPGAETSKPAIKKEPAKFPWKPIAGAKFSFSKKGSVYDATDEVLLSDEKEGVVMGHAVKYTTDLNRTHPLPAIKKGDVYYHSSTGKLLQHVTGYAPKPEKHSK